MDKQTEKLLQFGVLIGAAYVLVARPVLKLIGVDSTDTATVTAAQALTPANDPFNMAYQYGYIAYYGWSFPDAFVTEFQQFKNNGTPVQQVNDQIADSLYTAFTGFFPTFILWTADFTTIQSLFEKLDSKASCSYLDAFLQANYNVSLWSLLKNGTGLFPAISAFNTGLNDKQIAQLINYVSTLPNQVQGAIATPQNAPGVFLPSPNQPANPDSLNNSPVIPVY